MRARTRALGSFAVGSAVGGVLTAVAPWQVAVLTGWTLAATTNVGWSMLRLWHLDGAATAAHATLEDDSRPVADVLLLSAATASLGALGLALVKAASAHGPGKAIIITVAVLSVASSWALVQAVFALRYARTYFAEGGGVEFYVDEAPDYRDFAYLALTIGMTFQVSDTNIQSKTIRRIVIRHALVSYVFGAVVVAMAINIVAGLLGR